MSDTPTIDVEPIHWERSAEAIQEKFIEYFEARLEAGNRFVKASHIRRDLEYDPLPQKIGTNLGALCNKGVLEKWGTGTPATYRITLDDGGDD